MTVFFTGLAVLVVRDPWFGFFACTGYFFLMVLPWGWARVLGVLAIATITGTSQNGPPSASGPAIALSPQGAELLPAELVGRVDHLDAAVPDPGRAPGQDLAAGCGPGIWVRP